VPVGRANFDLNRCNESPLRGEKPDFWPVSKFNTGSLPLRDNPAGNDVTEFPLLGLAAIRVTSDVKVSNADHL